MFDSLFTIYQSNSIYIFFSKENLKMLLERNIKKISFLVFRQLTHKTAFFEVLFLNLYFGLLQVSYKFLEIEAISRKKNTSTYALKITYRHQCSCTLSKTVSFHTKFAGIAGTTINVTIRAIINSGRIQMTIANRASKTTFVPILEKSKRLIIC